MLSSNVILKPRDLKEQVRRFMDQPRFVFDVETVPPSFEAHTDLRGEHKVNRVLWMSFATAGQAFVLPLGHPNGNRIAEKERRRKDPVTKKFVITPPVWETPPEQIRPGEAMEILHPLLFHPEIEKGGHGFLFDLLAMLKYYDGEPIPGPYHDSILTAWILDENQRIGLKDLTAKRYKRKYDPEHVGRRVERHSFNKVARYAFMDARYTWLHLQRDLEEIESQGFTDLYNLEREVFGVVLDMERRGMPVDQPLMAELAPVLAKHREQCEGRVYKSAGRKFNLNSPKQKVDVLYGPKDEGGQGLQPWRLTKGGRTKDKKGLELTRYDYSTDAESIEKWLGKNAVVDAIADFQEVDRVLGTYLYGYLGFDDPEDSKKTRPCVIFDGRVYPDFVQYGTVTGRFSCRAPNLQNIPRADSELGKKIRAMFIAGPGHKLIVADYGQIELVVLAHFVGRGALFRGFFEGIDPHTMTAAVVFGQDPQELQARVNAGDEEAKNWRQAAKAINFAVVYGAGPDKVASMAKVSVKRAKEILNQHEREFPEVYKFKDNVIKACKSRKPPYLVTLKGRHRRIPAILSRDYGTAGRAERQAVNSLIQGSAADIIKVAMIRVHKALEEANLGAHLLLTVHDELVVRCPEENVEKAMEIMRWAMVGDGIAEMVDVPLSIDMNAGDNWAEAK